MGNIYHSESDSAILGLKTGHAVVSSHNIGVVVQQAIDEVFDICRLKVSETEKAAVTSALEQSGIAWHHVYDIVKYYPITAHFPPDMPLTDGASFELYTGQNPEMLAELIKQSYADDPIGYYLSPQLAKYVAKEQELQCLAEYLSHEFVGPNYRLWIVKMNGEPVGFTANRIDWEKKEYEGLHAGIVPEHRNFGLFASLIRYNINYSQTLGIYACPTGTRSHNQGSQRVFESLGILPTGTEAIIHLMPLLSAKNNLLADGVRNSQVNVFGR